jgi:hypothetical protein
MNDKVQHWFIKSFEDYMTIKILIDSPLMEYTTSINYLFPLPTDGRKAPQRIFNFP